MTAPGFVEVVLERDGHQQPWGFRLQGGHDVGVMLSVQRILVGTPSEGVLKRGDILQTIGKVDAKNLTHQQAVDLFTNAGNQIKVLVKRTGINSQSGSTKQPSLPVSGGVALHGMTALKTNTEKHPSKLQAGGSSSPAGKTTGAYDLTLQSQPYRTNPIIQPTPKIKVPDVGPGSTAHLRNQSEHLAGMKERVPVPVSPPAKIVQFDLKQKVAGTLQQIQQQGPQGSSIPAQRSDPVSILKQPASTSVLQSPPIHPSGTGHQVRFQYNNPIGLYSDENIKEVAKMNQAGIIPGKTTINPVVNKPPKSWTSSGGLPKSYDPEQSATWRALKELEDCQMITEHGAPKAKVYTLNL